MNIFTTIWNWIRNFFGLDIGNPTTVPAVGQWQIGPIINGVNSSHNIPALVPEGIFWKFDFPSQDGVHYVTTGHGGSIASYTKVHMVFELDGTGVVSNDGGAPLVRMYFQQAGDDWSGAGAMETYRWWGAGTSLKTPGTFTVDVPLTGDHWTDVYANDGIKMASGFAAAKANVQVIGFTFGGMFAGHGCYATSPSTFHLKEFSLQ